MSRAAVSQATNLQGTDSSNAAQANAQAQGINSTLNPFLQNELSHPQGIGQTGLTAELAAGAGGAGGANSGITGQANLEAARTRNASGFAGALDSAARTRQASLANQSEGITAQDQQLKQQQQQEAASGLQGLYGTDSGNALKALGLQNDAINTEVNAAKSGWLQNGLAIAGTALNGVSGLAGKGGAFAPGGRWG